MLHRFLFLLIVRSFLLRFLGTAERFYSEFFLICNFAYFDYHTSILGKITYESVKAEDPFSGLDMTSSASPDKQSPELFGSYHDDSDIETAMEVDEFYEPGPELDGTETLTSQLEEGSFHKTFGLKVILFFFIFSCSRRSSFSSSDLSELLVVFWPSFMFIVIFPIITFTLLVCWISHWNFDWNTDGYIRHLHIYGRQYAADPFYGEFASQKG